MLTAIFGSFIKVEIYTILAKLLFDTAAKSVGSSWNRSAALCFWHGRVSITGKER